MLKLSRFVAAEAGKGVERRPRATGVDHSATPMQVIRGGGELLERYRLPRGRIDVPAFLEARERGSILLKRSNKVPG